MIGWQATFATAAYLSGTLLQGLTILTHPSYVPQSWHPTMFYWAIVAFAVGVNIVGGSVLPRLEGFILVVHILGFFAVMIPLVTLADHTSASEVFTLFLNEGGWSSEGLLVFIGLIGTVFAFAGGDAAVHVSDNCP